MNRHSSALLLALSLVVIPGAAAFAQTDAPPAPVDLLTASPGPAATPGVEFVSTLEVAGPPSLASTPERPFFAAPGGPRRPSALVPMYVGVVALQGYDTYSTLSAVKKGAIEVNPLLMGAASRPAVFVAVKSAVTVGSIYAAERLWRRHRKGAAIGLMAVTNGLLAVVAANNASVLRRLR